MIQNIISYYRFFIPLIVLFAGFFFQNYLQTLYNNYARTNDGDVGQRDNVFSEEKLARYNGITEKKLYMAVLGIVYDVSSGKKHYAKDAPYHYFVGKDGSRALVTGDFKDESTDRDHVLDLRCADISSLLKWRESLEKKYKMIGLVAGRYFESNGEKTAYHEEFTQRIQECLREKVKEKQRDLIYPPCNLAWSEEVGTKVWCTKTSGGIKRDWVGVPRQLYSPGDQKPRCVCVKPDEEQDTSVGLFKVYKGCSNESVTCFVET